MENFDYARLVYLLGLMILVWPGIYYFRRNASKVMRYLLIWIAIGLSVAIIYLLFGGAI